jgi:hypothetical protein
MRRSRFSEEQIAMALRQADAATRLAMETRGDCFFSVSSRLAYPIIQDSPILRVEQAILASSLG